MQCDKYSLWDQEKVSEDLPRGDWLILKLKRNSWGMKRKIMTNRGNCCSASTKLEQEELMISVLERVSLQLLSFID